jgi:hypothetical protein
MSRTYEAIRKQLNLDFLVATNRRAIVATNEPAGASRFVVARQKAFVETIELDFDALRLKASDICSNNP